MDLDVLVVHVEDRFGHDCSIPLSGFCLFVVEENGGPANFTVDAYQRVDYVGVGTDFQRARDAIGDAWLLPDRSLSQNGSDLYLHNPAIRFATEEFNKVEQPDGPIHVWMTSDNITATYPMFHSWDDPTRVSPYRYYLVDYNEDERFGYERVGPVTTPANWTTDKYAASLQWFCKSPACATFGGPTFGTYYNATPDIAFGWGFGQLEVATDPSNLSYAHTQSKEQGENTALSRTDEIGSAHEPNRTASRVARLREFRPGSQPLADANAEPFLGRNPTEVQAHPPGPEGLGPNEIAPFLLQVTTATVAALLLAALGAALYSRFNSRDEALKSELRQRLLSIVRESPGISLAEVTERMGLARSTVTHHLRVLERVHLVRVVEDGKLRLFYATGTQVVKAPAWLRRNPVCLAILAMLDAAPEGLTRDAVQARLPDVPERTRNYHLKRLVDVGALVQESSPDGRKVFRKAEGWTGGAGSSSSGTA